MKKVYVSLTGGLGNQLFQLSAATSMSSFSKVIGITSTGNPRKSEGYYSEAERLKFSGSISFKHQSEFTFIKKLVGFNLRCSIKPRRMEKNFIFQWTLKFISSVILSIYLKDIVVCITGSDIGFTKFAREYRFSIFLIGYFQSFKYSNTGIRKIFRNALENIEVENAVSEIALECKKTKPLVVHVRRGDYINEAEIGLLSNDFFNRSIREHLSRDQYRDIWIFSDEPAKVMNMIANQVGLSTKIKIINEFIDDAIATLFIMSNGAGFVISNSTFSWWAANLRQNENSRVTYPSPWFKIGNSPKEICNKNWIAIESSWA